jgi:predicted RNA binding protein YcfA (HicA-like mRNA interferase family)
MIWSLEDDDWVHARTRGSHRQFHHPVETGTVTKSGKANKVLSIFSEKSVFREAGMARTGQWLNRR